MNTPSPRPTTPEPANGAPRTGRDTHTAAPSDIGELPAAHWPDAEHPANPPHPAGGLTASTGMLLGVDRAANPVTLPAVGPRGTRIGVLGESLFGRLLACRLLAVGVQVTAVTRGPPLWKPLCEAAGERLVLADHPGSWPPHAPQPPGSGRGPQALISDRRRPPPVPTGSGRWCTVAHVRRQPPRHAGFWNALDVLLALGDSFAAAVAPIAGDGAAEVTAGLAPGEVAMFWRGASTVLRPEIAPGETALLTPE